MSNTQHYVPTNALATSFEMENVLWNAAILGTLFYLITLVLRLHSLLLKGREAEKNPSQDTPPNVNGVIESHKISKATQEQEKQQQKSDSSQFLSEGKPVKPWLKKKGILKKDPQSVDQVVVKYSNIILNEKPPDHSLGTLSITPNPILASPLVDSVNDNVHPTPLSCPSPSSTNSSIPPNTPQTPRDPTSYGYVFLLFGDITEIYCDCWLGSGGATLDARHLPYFPPSANMVDTGPPPETERGKKSMYSKLSTYSPWPEDLPVPYTIHLRSNRTTEYFVRDTERFIRVAAEDMHRRNGKKIRKNVCPLLAMPLIGTGYGGNFSKTGEMMKSVLPVLYSLAEELKVDIALVFIEQEVFSLAQAVRRRFLMEQSKDSPLYKLISGRRYLQPQLLQKIPFLASQASQGELTLFVGAGVSMGAGLPSWGQLLTNIAKKLDFSSEELKEFETLDYYSRAAVLEQKIETQRNPSKRQSQRKLTVLESFEKVLKEITTNNGDQAISKKRSGAGTTDRMEKKEGAGFVSTELGSLYEMVAHETQGRGYTVMHSLIASLPVKEIITTNYDEMMERAWLYAGPFSVLPYSPLRGSSRWMLKLHGTVSRPKEIVLTKRDYIRYNDRFAALAGIVQSTLLTRHLLSIGFSLADDNFHKIFDSVRKAKSSEQDILFESTAGSGMAASPFSSSSYLFRKYEKSRFDPLTAHDDIVVMAPPMKRRGGKQYSSHSSEDCDCTALILKYSRLKVCSPPFLTPDPASGQHLEWLNEIDIQYLEDPNPSSLSPSTSSEDNFAELARLQEIFLDILSSHCSRNQSTKFLMKERYVDALSAEELEMKDHIRTIIDGMMSLSSEAKKTKAFHHLRKSIHELGG